MKLGKTVYNFTTSQDVLGQLADRCFLEHQSSNRSIYLNCAKMVTNRYQTPIF